MSGAEALRAALKARGGTLGELASNPPPTPPSPSSPAASAEPGPAQLAARGPRAAPHAQEYELLLEMILEGSLLHYAQPRVVNPDSADLGLLLGDQLYALGLGRLAELGDVEAVGELADVISLISQAALAADDELAQAVWEAGAVAIGWGGDPVHEQAKHHARSERPGAAGRLRDAAALRSRS